MIEVSDALSRKFRNAALLCSLFVVIIHCVSHFHIGYAPIRMAVYDGICRVAVPFFFFTSGFFLAAHIGEKGWYKRELLKRVKTLVVPFVALTLLYWAFHYNTNQSILSIFGLDPRRWPLLVPLWYIRGLIALIIISPILARFSSWVGVFALFALYGAIAPWEGIPGNIVFFFRKVIPLQGAFYFTFGIAVRKSKIKMLSLSSNQSILILLSGILILAAKVISQHIGFAHYHYLGWLSVPFLVVSLINMMPDVKLSNSLISCAFPIYLVHVFVIDLAVSLTARLGIDASGNLLIGCLMTAGVFLISLAGVWIQRRIFPFMNQTLYGGR